MSDMRPLVWIPQKARALAAAGMIQGRAWSLGQVCEHLALAFEATLPGDKSSTPSGRGGVWRRVRQFVMKRTLLLTGRFPHGVPAPDLVVPSNSPDLESSLDRLEAAVTLFVRACDRRGMRWPDHPILGAMSGKEWGRFHSIHAAHHFSFFRLPSDSASVSNPTSKGEIA